MTETCAHHYALNQNGRLMGKRKGGIYDIKKIQMGMFIEKGDKLIECVQVLMSKSTIGEFDYQPKQDQDMLACALCSSYEYIEVHCPKYDQVMGVNSQFKPDQHVSVNSWQRQIKCIFKLEL